MQKISTIYRTIYVMLTAAALVMDFGIFQGRMDWYILNYYTILSNIACLVFFAVLLIRRHRAIRTPPETFPRTEGVIVFTITITGLIYALILGPGDFARAACRFFSFSNMMLHYVGPAMVVLDWLLFCQKGRLRSLHPLKWLLIPLSYFGYILVRSTFAGNIGAAALPVRDTGSAFPYGFIDPAVQGGWGEMFAGVTVIALCMAVLGYLVYLADRILVHRT